MSDRRPTGTDVNRLPFTLLGGYLGAGKTTIVNRLLAESVGRRLVVLVNDVGAVNVDAALIARHDGETLELTNGCVCCAIADDLGPALERVRVLVDDPTPPDQVVMELSGVAEPARVAPWANTTGFRLDGIVVCADAEQIVGLAGRRFVGDTIRTQLEAADVVLLTKTDLATDAGAAARAFIAGVSDAPVVDARAGEVARLLTVGGSGTVPPSRSRRSLAGDRHGTAAIDVAGRTLVELERLVAELPDDVVRAKAVVRCTDRGHPVEVHLVGSRREIRERPDLPLDAASDTLITVTA